MKHLLGARVKVVHVLVDRFQDRSDILHIFLGQLLLVHRRRFIHQDPLGLLKPVVGCQPTRRLREQEPAQLAGKANTTYEARKTDNIESKSIQRDKLGITILYAGRENGLKISLFSFFVPCYSLIREKRDKRQYSYINSITG